MHRILKKIYSKDPITRHLKPGYTDGRSQLLYLKSSNDYKEGYSLDRINMIEIGENQGKA